MTHTPSESKAWPRAGAADRPSASGEQLGGRDQPASDLPAAAADDSMEGLDWPFPEAGRHETDAPQRDTRRGSTNEADQARREADAPGRGPVTGSGSERG